MTDRGTLRDHDSYLDLENRNLVRHSPGLESDLGPPGLTVGVGQSTSVEMRSPNTGWAHDLVLDHSRFVVLALELDHDPQEGGVRWVR